MKLSDFDYNLPKSLIAQAPSKPRDHSRLLVLDKKTGQIEHRHFFNIVDYLQAGDILVMNNSKVFPARLLGTKKETGGKMEVFLHRHEVGKKWQCLLGGRGAKVGLVINFSNGVNCEVLKNNEDGTWQVKFNLNKKELLKKAEKIGLIPLPPYIKRMEKEELRNNNDKESYQTVYADEKKVGSAAAPTAGLHFTPELIKKLKAKGVKFEYVTLHVGLGTFAPVKVDDITKHKMHSEWVEIKKTTLEKIMKAKKAGRRVIAVGTTSTRSLETAFGEIQNSKFKIQNFKTWVDIFIYPGYKFKTVDGMITNFHLPKSTLLMLISAFACAECGRSAGKNNIDKAYQEAIKKGYRFYSYGDAMLIV